MKKLWCAGLLLVTLTAGAQTFDSAQYVHDSLEIVRLKLVRPQVKLDNRVTFFQKQGLAINGFDIGVLLSEKLRLTLGYYNMHDRLRAFDYTTEGAEFGRFVRLNYGSLNTELIYSDKRFVSLGMPLEIGAGKNRFEDRNVTSGQTLSVQSGALLFVNFGMSATFKPMRFLGLKAIVGYRKMVFNQVKDYDFDGFFTAIGLNFDLHAVITDIRMYRLMKRNHRGNNISNAVKILTD